MAPAIPDRWLDYTPIGKKVKGTRFIAFKVPLREHVVESVPQDNRLTCHSLLTQVPNLGLIIDLTNTKRYYDPIFFTDNGVQYEKLMIPGREVPPEQFVKTFKMFVNDFLRENSNNSKLIGVHCTHGVNRTGYLISSYMISELKMKPQDAIKRFENARGHDIERRNYINHLTAPISSSTNLQNHDNQEPPFGKWRQRHYRDRPSCYQRPFPNHEDSRDIQDSRSLPNQYKYDNNNRVRPSCYQRPLPRHNNGTYWRSFPNGEDSRDIRDSRSLPNQYKYNNRFHIMNQNRNQS